MLCEAYAPAQMAKRVPTVAYLLGGAGHVQGLQGGQRGGATN